MAQDDSSLQLDRSVTSNVTRCPRCEVIGLLHVAKDIPGHFTCIRCHGEFLNREQVQVMVIDQLGIDSKMLSELMEFRGGNRLLCPQCNKTSSAFVLRGFALELCGSCGGIWADHGVILELVNSTPPTPAVAAKESKADIPSAAGGGHLRSQARIKAVKAQAKFKRPVKKSFFHAALTLVLVAEVLFVFSLWQLESGAMDVVSWLGLLLALAMLMGMLVASRFMGR